MPNITVTPDAATEIRKRIKNATLPNTILAIFRLNKGADLRRGAHGEAIWTMERAAISYGCQIVAMPPIETWQIFVTEGIRIGISTIEMNTVNRVATSLLDGEPHVQIDA
jgi:hypothetical protein